MTEDEKRWLKEAEENKWTLPVVPRWKRLPVIRRIRFIWLSFQVYRHAEAWGSVGIGLGQPDLLRHEHALEERGEVEPVEAVAQPLSPMIGQHADRHTRRGQE